MLSRYRAAYAPPGALAFSAAGFVARFAVAIYPIGLVLIVSARTHTYGFAGVVSGCYVFGGAVGAPIGGRLVDRFGQRSVLLRFALAHLGFVACLGVLLAVRAPLWTLLPPAVGMGVSFLSVGALIRARWSYVWADEPIPRSTAYSIESALDEVVFVLGPLVATLLATHLPGLATLSVAIAMILLGSGWLAGQVRTEPPVRPRQHGERRQFVLAVPGVQLLTWMMACMGAVFGGAEVTMVAFCGQHGQRGNSGWVIACFAGGSMVAGFGYGARHWNSPLLRRFVWSAVVFGLLPLLYLVADSVPAVAICTFFVGLGVAPTLIGGFGLIDQIVPANSLTEGLTWLITGLSVGYGAAAALVGGIADRHGAHIAFLVPIGSALAATGFAVALAVRIRSPAPPGDGGRRAVIAGKPAEVEVPAVVLTLAAGQPIRPVWHNEVGGLTFALGPDGGDRYVKWTPPDSGIDLAREADRLRWAIRYLPVPEPLGAGQDESGSWLLTRAIPGRNAVDPRWLADPATAATALGSGLRRLHDALPPVRCPFSWSSADRVAAVRRRAAAGLLDPSEWHAEYARQPIERLLDRLMEPPPVDRLVVCHGDACAPNTLLDDAGRVAGYVDLGSLGVADRWADLAVGSWSLDWNYGAGYQPTFFRAYGIEPDPRRIAYYRLLWDLGE